MDIVLLIAKIKLSTDNYTIIQVIKDQGKPESFGRQVGSYQIVFLQYYLVFTLSPIQNKPKHKTSSCFTENGEIAEVDASCPSTQKSL